MVANEDPEQGRTHHHPLLSQCQMLLLFILYLNIPFFLFQSARNLFLFYKNGFEIHRPIG